MAAHLLKVSLVLVDLRLEHRRIMSSVFLSQLNKIVVDWTMNLEYQKVLFGEF